MKQLCHNIINILRYQTRWKLSEKIRHPLTFKLLCMFIIMPYQKSEDWENIHF